MLGDSLLAPLLPPRTRSLRFCCAHSNGECYFTHAWLTDAGSMREQRNEETPKRAETRLDRDCFLSLSTVAGACAAHSFVCACVLCCMNSLFDTSLAHSHQTHSSFTLRSRLTSLALLLSSLLSPLPSFLSPSRMVPDLDRRFISNSTLPACCCHCLSALAQQLQLRGLGPSRRRADHFELLGEQPVQPELECCRV